MDISDWVSWSWRQKRTAKKSKIKKNKKYNSLILFVLNPWDMPLVHVQLLYMRILPVFLKNDI